MKKKRNIFNGGDNLPFQLGLPADFLAKGKIRSRTDHFRERIQLYVQSHCHFNFETLQNNRLFLMNTVRTFKKTRLTPFFRRIHEQWSMDYCFYGKMNGNVGNKKNESLKFKM